MAPRRPQMTVLTWTNQACLLFVALSLGFCNVITAGPVTSDSDGPECAVDYFKCHLDCCKIGAMYCSDREQRCKSCEIWDHVCDNDTLVPLACLRHCYIRLHPPAEGSDVPWSLIAVSSSLGGLLTIVILAGVALCVCLRGKPVAKWPACLRALLNIRAEETTCDAPKGINNGPRKEEEMPLVNPEDVSISDPTSHLPSTASLATSPTSDSFIAPEVADRLTLTPVNGDGDSDDTDVTFLAHGPATGHSEAQGNRPDHQDPQHGQTTPGQGLPSQQGAAFDRVTGLPPSSGATRFASPSPAAGAAPVDHGNNYASLPATNTGRVLPTQTASICREGGGMTPQRSGLDQDIASGRIETHTQPSSDRDGPAPSFPHHAGQAVNQVGSKDQFSRLPPTTDAGDKELNVIAPGVNNPTKITSQYYNYERQSHAN